MIFETADIYDHQYQTELLIYDVFGGVPADRKTIEGWIRKGVGIDHIDQIVEMVQETMADRAIKEGKTVEELLADPDALADAIENTADAKINGFKRTDTNELYIEGRQVKAMLKEAANVAVASGDLPKMGWGKTNKGLMGFLPEHLFIPERKIGLGVTEPTGVEEGFVHTWQGSAIKREEYVENAKVAFTVLTDHDFGKDFWKVVWTRAQALGLGASRSQGRGQFEVTRWEKIEV